MEGMIGQIYMFGSNFNPRNWAFCDGQLLPIAQNTAMFSILGTTYGGDGETTFGLPDMRSRVPFGAGNGPGLPSVQLGQKSGAETVTLTTGHLPAHNHSVTPELAIATGNATSDEPDGNIIANPANEHFGPLASANAHLAGTSLALASTGGGQPFSIVQPVLAVRYIICMFGVFPSRS